MASTLRGPGTWQVEVDEEGYRTYKATFLVNCLSTDGPAIVLSTPGLPQPGDTWNFAGWNGLTTSNEIDEWATCRQTCTVTPVLKDEPNTYFKIEKTFSTKGATRCQDDKVEDPLNVPQKISITFSKYTEEASYDRFKEPILNSAFEMLRGPHVEFDANRFTVKIEQNVANAQLPLLSQMRDTVNSDILWGMPKRCVKLSSASAERKFYGTCKIYWTRSLEFEVRDETFDRDILDEGTKVLNGEWDKVSGKWVLKDIGTLSAPTITDLTVNDGGGTLPTALYSYRVSATNDKGESLASDALTIDALVPSTFGIITIYWKPVTGATGYKVYGRTAGSELLIASGPIVTVNPDLLAFDDDGSETPAGALPTVNTASTPPDPTNPSHFIRFTDRKGNPCKVVLDGHGLPAGEVKVASTTGTADAGTTGEAGSIHVEKYDESNFLLLGIPSVLDLP